MRDAAEELERFNAVHDYALALRDWCSATNGNCDDVLRCRLADPANEGEVVVLRVPGTLTAVSLLQPDLCGATLAAVRVAIDPCQSRIEWDTLRNLSRHPDHLRRHLWRRRCAANGDWNRNAIHRLNDAWANEHATIDDRGVCDGKLHERCSNAVAKRGVR